MCEYASEDCSADGMVGTADGTWHNAEGGFRVEGEVLRVSEECTGEDGGHARVLHADFDGNGTFFGGVELEQTTDIVTEYITKGVVQEYDSEHEGNKAHAVRQKLRTYGHDYAADDQCETDDAHSGHVCLKFLKSCALAEEVVAGKPDHDREDCHVKDVEEHANGIYFDARVGEPKDQNWSHERGEERACHRHTDGVSDIAFSQETHHVARNAARAATDKHDADSQIRVQSENLCERECDEWHDGVLCHGTEENVAGAFHQIADVVHGNGKAHAEHDDAENDGACVPVHPAEEYRGEKRDNRAGDNEEGGIC